MFLKTSGSKGVVKFTYKNNYGLWLFSWVVINLTVEKSIGMIPA